MSSLEDIKSYVERAIKLSDGKVDATIAKATILKGSQIRFSQSEIDINKRWESLNLDLFIVIDGKKTGFSGAPIESINDVDKLIESTIEFTKHLPESILFAGLEETVKDYPRIEEGYDSRIDDFAEIAPSIVNSAIDAALSEGAVRVAGALKFSEEITYLLSSYGPGGEMKQTSYDLNVRAFQEELDYSGQGLNCGTKPSVSEKEMVAAGAEAGRLSKMAIGAKQGEPGTYDLIMSPTVAANVIGYVPSAANPFMLMLGLSPLEDKMGEQIAPKEITVHDNPLFPGGLASQRFDFEGTPSQNTTLIKDGVLKKLVHNTTTAKMYETESTGNSGPMSLGQGLKMLLPVPTNIVFENGRSTLDEMMDTHKPTIYVTSNWYTRWQNYQTGEFSTIPRDAMFLIEKGNMKPIKNLRLSDNILRLFSNISSLGNDRKQIFWWEVDVPTIIPTLKIDDCRMTAATQ